jgi:hypothetical protein
MAGIMIRDVPDRVRCWSGCRAARLGVSRVEYVRRRLAAGAAISGAPVLVKGLRDFGVRFADLAEDEVVDAAWR